MIRTTQSITSAYECLSSNLNCHFEKARVIWLISGSSIHSSKRYPTSRLRCQLTLLSRSFCTSRAYHEASNNARKDSVQDPAANRLNELSAGGFHGYPRSDGTPISRLKDFRTLWTDKIPAGETEKGDQATVGMIA